MGGATMTLDFERLGQLARAMRDIANDSGESIAVRTAARDIVFVLTQDSEQIFTRLIGIATDRGRTDAARTRAMELLLVLL